MNDDLALVGLDTLADFAAPPRRSIGVVGGLGMLAGADFLCKLVQSLSATGRGDRVDLAFEQHPLPAAALASGSLGARKLHVFDLIRDFEARGVDTIALPCFLSHTFIGELQANTTLQIVDMLRELRAHIRDVFPTARRIGVLASPQTRETRLFERYFGAPHFEIVHPRRVAGVDLVTQSVYGEQGIQAVPAGSLRAIDDLRVACDDLAEQGVDLILPGLTDLNLVLPRLGRRDVPVIDTNLVYAQRVAAGERAMHEKPFKIGVVGGVGPAATVDFLQKIVRHTDARRDQDHVKLLVEQNPQIPDRTENLIGAGPDPTIALYATCKKLEDGGASLIAIPCNTAHAFVERIQPYLKILVVNMLDVTARHVAATLSGPRRVGVLATTGTVASGVYERALAIHGVEQALPSAAAQLRVMEAIYGSEGVKAGFVEGACQDDIRAAIEDLAAQGVDVMILGCTELPVLLPHPTIACEGGRVVTLVDPTAILAGRCASIASAALRRERLH